MMLLFHNTPFRRLLPGFLLLLFAFSCRQEDPIALPTPAVPGSGETATVKFTIDLPGFSDVAATRADGISEWAVNNLCVFLFANEGGVEKVKVKKVLEAARLQHSTAISGETKVTTFIPVTEGSYTRLVLVANAEAELNSAGIGVGSTYAALKSVEAADRYGKAYDYSGVSSYIPMYGEYAPAGGFQLQAGVSRTLGEEISLIRMLAKVIIQKAAALSTMGVESDIHFFNVAKSGKIYTDPAAYGAGSGYVSPNLPASLEHAGTGANHLLSVAGSTSGTTLLTYYLNEQPATSAVLSTATNSRPGILLRLHYDGKPYYYRLDFTWDGVKGGGGTGFAKGTPMPILRNHSYIFTIQAVKGPGFMTMEEAINSPENHTNHQNLHITPVVVDDAFTDVKFDDSGYFLAVDRTAIVLKGSHTSTSSENHFSIKTNYPSGWKLTAYQYDGTQLPASAWLTPSHSNGTANATANLQALTQGEGWKFGYFEIQAGRLQHRVDVILLGKSPLEYVAQYNLAGGYQYGSSFYRALNGNPWLGGTSVPASPTPAQTDGNLRFATSHDNNQSGYYNGFVCIGMSQDTYNPDSKDIRNDHFFRTGEGKDFHIPSSYEMAGVLSTWTYAHYGSSVDYQNVVEVLQVGDVIQTYSGDFYSTGNGIGYALRFKKGMQHDSDALTVPLAATHSMAYAFRYERVGTMSTYLNTTDHLKVQCVYVGYQSPLPDLKTKIAQESWWNAQPPNTVTTRIFPTNGLVSDAIPGSVSANYLRNRGITGYYHSLRPETMPNLPHLQLFETYIMHDVTKTTGVPLSDYKVGKSIRLFSNK